METNRSSGAGNHELPRSILLVYTLHSGLNSRVKTRASLSIEAVAHLGESSRQINYLLTGWHN